MSHASPTATVSAQNECDARRPLLSSKEGQGTPSSPAGSCSSHPQQQEEFTSVVKPSRQEEGPADHTEHHQEGCWVRWKPALLMCLLTFFFSTSNTVLSPVWPGIKRRYFGGDQQAAFVSSLVESITAIVAIFLAPLCGLLMDSYGRRPFFVFFSVWNLLPKGLACVFPTNPVPFMATYYTGRLVSTGFFSAYIADHYNPKLRVSAYGMFNAAAQLSALSGLLSAALSDQAIFLVAFGFQCVGSLIALLAVRESISADRVKDFSFASIENPFHAMKGVATSKVMIAAIFLGGVFTVSELGVGEVYMYFLNQRIGFNKTNNAVAYAEAGLLMPLVLLVVVPVATRVFKVRQVTLLMAASVGLAVEMVSLCLVSYKWEAYAVVVPLTALISISFPAVSALVANAGPESNQGRRQVGYTAMNDVFKALAPLTFGQMYSHLSGDWVLLPFILAAFIAIPAFFVAYKLREWVIHKENNIIDDDEPDGEFVPGDGVDEEKQEQP